MLCTWAPAIQAVLANYFKVVLDFEKSFLIDHMPDMTKGQEEKSGFGCLDKDCWLMWCRMGSAGGLRISFLCSRQHQRWVRWWKTTRGQHGTQLGLCLCVWMFFFLEKQGFISRDWTIAELFMLKYLKMSSLISWPVSYIGWVLWAIADRCLHHSRWFCRCTTAAVQQCSLLLPHCLRLSYNFICVFGAVVLSQTPPNRIMILASNKWYQSAEINWIWTKAELRTKLN